MCLSCQACLPFSLRALAVKRSSKSAHFTFRLADFQTLPLLGCIKRDEWLWHEFISSLLTFLRVSFITPLGFHLQKQSLLTVAGEMTLYLKNIKSTIQIWISIKNCAHLAKKLCCCKNKRSAPWPAHNTSYNERDYTRVFFSLCFCSKCRHEKPSVTKLFLREHAGVWHNIHESGTKTVTNNNSRKCCISAARSVSET